MNQYFLKQAASYFLSQYNADTESIAVVFPGKRPIRYFNNYLSEISEKPVWAPAYHTISGLMETLSGYTVAVKLTLIFELYDAFKRVTNTTEQIDDFFYYAAILLSDFDDIDKYLVNPHEIFQNLAGLKSIENHFDYLDADQLKIIGRFWDSFKHGKLSGEKSSFVSLWEVMPAVYDSFKSSLQQKGIAYEGMIYRKVAEDIAAGQLETIGVKKFIFIGFNALNKAEERLLNHLKTKGMAEFLWDYDHYYINNSVHEAGFFIRENIKRFPAPDIGMNFEGLTRNDKKITFVNAPSNTGQTGALSFFMKDLPRDYENPVNTAVVLADESLLLPVLSAVPGSYKDMNVTMGFPVMQSSIYHLVNCIVNLHANSRNSAGNTLRFYHKDVIALLNLPEINIEEADRVKELKKSIIESNAVYPAAEDVAVSGMLKLITGLPGNAKKIPEYFLNILTKLAADFVLSGDQNSNHTWQAEMLYLSVVTFKQMKELIEGAQIELSTGMVFNIILKSLAELSIPFSGEPLKGLQVMGILETRVLDFENVIIFSMNEGIFPKTGNPPTFIPLGLRYGFGLPVPEHRDAIYAYYFYRLIQRAKNICLVYNSRHDGMATGERSRFLHQLYYDPVFKVEEKVIVPDVVFTLPKKIQAAKDDRVMKILQKYLGDHSGSYFTPSAINTYLNCQLRFYFKYIVGLKEPDILSEELDPALFGSVLHKAMELLYSPFVGKILNDKAIEEIQQNGELLAGAADQAFSDEFFNGKKTEISGRNIILREIILKYIQQILEFDKRYAPFRLVALEKKYIFDLDLPDGHQLRIGGIIDRIDEKEGVLRIVDYKTGVKKNTFENTDELFDQTGSKRNSAVFQIFLYSLVMQKNEGRDAILPGLYFIRSMFNPEFDFRVIEQQGKSQKTSVDNAIPYLSEFEKRLKVTLAQLFDNKVHFVQTNDMEVCKNCPYNTVCHRESTGNK
ncbi:MAG: PD-(D/E)XK nuclease family protein [Bacteroidales bacterium]|nr:PD-(D/E)XK nuclease family protein [Bacteroidales bacterium]